MSSSGLVILTDGDGIAAKVIAGCNGQQAQTLAHHIAAEQPTSLEDIAELALRLHFGCPSCLVVMTSTQAFHSGDQDLHQRYWDTFWKRDANPRLAPDLDHGFQYSISIPFGHLVKEVS